MVTYGRRRWKAAALVTALAISVGGCGGGSDDGPAATSTVVDAPSEDSTVTSGTTVTTVEAGAPTAPALPPTGSDEIDLSELPPPPSDSEG